MGTPAEVRCYRHMIKQVGVYTSAICYTWMIGRRSEWHPCVAKVVSGLTHELLLQVIAKVFGHVGEVVNNFLPTSTANKCVRRH